MSGIRRALAFSFLERYLLLAVTLGSNMAIARLLTPTEIGIFSVSLAVIGIAQVLRDFGIANYLIQEHDLTEARIRSAFGVALALGAAMFLAVYFASAPIARYYDEPATASILQVCALNFLAMPFCTISLALLRRELAFRALALVNFTAALAGALLSVGLAWLGFGVISLAIGAVLVNVVTGAGAWLALSDRRFLLPSFSEWRRVFGFGAQSSLASVVTSISMDTNDLVVGKVMGFEPVAILSRAQGLMNLFHRDIMSAIRNVAFPAYARAHREKEALEPLYIASVTHVTVIAWPFYGFVGLYGLEMLRLLFGSQWDAAVALVPVFCLAGALAAPANLIAPLILAVGRVDLVTKVELIWQPFRAALIVAAAVAFNSMMACAIALVAALLVQLPLLYWVKGKCLSNDYATLLRRLSSSLLVSMLSLAIPAAIALSFGIDRHEPVPISVFLASAASCALTWLAAITLTRHPLALDPSFRRILGWISRITGFPRIER